MMMEWRNNLTGSMPTFFVGASNWILEEVIKPKLKGFLPNLQEFWFVMEWPEYTCLAKRATGDGFDTIRGRLEKSYQPGVWNMLPVITDEQRGG